MPRHVSQYHSCGRFLHCPPTPLPSPPLPNRTDAFVCTHAHSSLSCCDGSWVGLDWIEFDATVGVYLILILMALMRMVRSIRPTDRPTNDAMRHDTTQYFRDAEGQDVLLFVDNIFRFTQAGAEVSALLGRIPSAVGYQPTLATDMGMLQVSSFCHGSTDGIQSNPIQSIVHPTHSIPLCRSFFVS